MEAPIRSIERLWLDTRAVVVSPRKREARTVRFMLLWLVICFTGVIGPIANAAHVIGLLAGIALGLARL